MHNNLHICIICISIKYIDDLYKQALLHRYGNQAIMMEVEPQRMDSPHQTPPEMHHEDKQPQQEEIYHQENNDNAPRAKSVPTPQQLKRRKQRKRRQLEQRQANQFLKQPVIKIVNLNKNLKRSYEKGFLDESKYEYIRTLRKLRKHPQQDSVSSHYGSDQQFDIKEYISKRGRKKKNIQADLSSSDSNSQRPQRKRKVTRTRKPKVKKQNVDQNGQPIPKKPRRPRVKQQESKPKIKITKKVKPAQQIKETAKPQQRTAKNKGQSQKQSSQSSFKSSEKSSQSLDIKNQKESKQPKIIQNKLEEEKPKIKELPQPIVEKPIVTPTPINIQQSLPQRKANPQLIPANGLPSGQRNNLLPPSIIRRGPQASKQTAIVMKKTIQQQSSSSQSSSSSSQSSSSGSDSTSKQKKKKKHKKYKGSSSQSSNQKKKKKKNKKQKKNKYEETETAKESHMQQDIQKKDKINAAYKDNEGQAQSKTDKMEQKGKETVYPLAVKSQIPKKLKQVPMQQPKKVFKLQSQSITVNLQQKDTENQNYPNSTFEVKPLKNKQQPKQQRKAKPGELSKQNKKQVQLKFDPKVVVLSLMASNPVSIQKGKDKQARQAVVTMNNGRQLQVEQISDDSSAYSYIEYPKNYRRPHRKIVRYRKAIASSGSDSDSSSNEYIRKIVKRIKKPSGKLMIEPPSESEESIQHRLVRPRQPNTKRSK